MERIEGPTPLGGDYAEAFWLDAEGNEVEAAQATRGEIVEYTKDGLALSRTYLDYTDVPEGLRQDRGFGLGTELENTDWIKTGTWDVWVEGWDHQVETKDELVVYLGVAQVPVEQQRREVGRFMALPAWEPAPQRLKAEVGEWLVTTRPATL